MFLPPLCDEKKLYITPKYFIENKKYGNNAGTVSAKKPLFFVHQYLVYHHFAKNQSIFDIYCKSKI